MVMSAMIHTALILICTILINFLSLNHQSTLSDAILIVCLASNFRFKFNGKDTMTRKSLKHLLNYTSIIVMDENCYTKR